MTSLDKYAIRDTIHKAIVRLNVHPVSDTAMNVGGGFSGTRVPVGPGKVWKTYQLLRQW